MPSVSDNVRRVRKNHALEHATVAMLLDDGVEPPLGGYSIQRGFLIFGRPSEEEVAEAASEALERLKSGERELAVSPHCGTNIATGGVLAGVMLGAVMSRLRGRLMRLPAAAMAVAGASILSRPIGNALQSRYTTLADVQDLFIEEVRPIWSGAFSVHWVGTTFDH